MRQDSVVIIENSPSGLVIAGASILCRAGDTIRSEMNWQLTRDDARRLSLDSVILRHGGGFRSSPQEKP
jgi:hypothetical protein